MTFTAPAQNCPSTCTGDHTIVCDRGAGHQPPELHGAGELLTWWDPPKLLIDGEPYVPADGEVTFSWER